MTRTLTAEAVCDTGAHHGEGPLWHVADRRLDWTDLLAGHLHRFDPVTGKDEVFDIGSPLGAFAARAGGGFVLAVEGGFAFFDARTGDVDLVAPVDYGPGPMRRMNDGKCDPHGRFWAGTMAYNVAGGAGALYRLDPDLTVTEVLDGVTIANGLDWTDDSRSLYYIDSLAGGSVGDFIGGKVIAGLDAFDFDGASGQLSGRRRVFDIPTERSGPTGMTVPDGMTLDAEGFAWIAVHGSGQVRRYSPAGEIDTVVELPVACPTSVAFGGDDLGRLYITTMTPGGPPGDDPKEPRYQWDPKPLEGALFCCRPGVTGRLPRSFAG